MNPTEYDQVIVDIAHYVYHYEIKSQKAWDRARTALLDAIGCVIQTAATSADCKDLLGPVSPGTVVPYGFKLPGTCYQLDPVKGAYDLGTMVRYLDHNDALAGADWGHPSDNLGAIIAVGDWLCRNEEAGRIVHTGPPLTLQTLLIALIKAYEIQGLFLLRNAFNAVGLDHTILVKLASTAVTSWILGLSEEQCKSAISHVWMDASPLRVYRSGSNTIPRKGWAAGDACMRAVQFALVTKKGQPGAPTVLTQPRWGFYTTAWRGRSEFELPLDYGSWVVEHVFFKVMPVEGHGISAVEAALVQLRRLQAKGMTPEKHIRRIRIRTCAAAKLIIDKAGTLHNAADRDHCMQYVVSVALLKGSFPEHTDYSNTSPYATSPEIERLSSITEITTDDGLTRDYMDLEKRSLPSGVTLELMNGEVLPEVLVEYPAGHPRHDQTPDMLRRKFHKNMSLMFSGPEIETIERQVADAGDARISGFIDLLSRNCSTRL